ncbi:hypothetical protein BDW42DRAFT_37510 [Aspergillus taichungensis]|uniref:Uncharacterized protein n=1 Tax=Aspergillus taichungensis TaxID=482145 RepID=A0A2J5HF52_9EURO|nr:hypothetical protein BDW42DRAFT_37510 [Aspergillus taichungensis]
MHNTEESNTSLEENSLEDLKNYDWEQLQERYLDLMEKHGETEEQLQAQISNLLEIFAGWSRVTVVRDETRAFKRFKTQLEHVQNSEDTLEQKRKHYVAVVEAFENALALLNGRLQH